MIWLISACLLWGPSFGLVPILIGEYGMNAYTLSVLRMAFALILFAPLMRLRSIPFRKKLQLALLGGLQFGVMYLTLFVSYRFMAGYEIALVTILTPLYVSLLDHAYRKNKLKVLPLFCVILAVLGAGIIRYARQPMEINNYFWIGFGIMQVCNLSFAIGQVIYRQITKPGERLEDMYTFGWMYMGALAVTLLGWLFLGQPANSLQHLQELPLPAWGIVLWLGLMPSGIAFFLFNHGALKVDSDTLAIVNNLKIPIALLIVMLLFQQRESVESWPNFFTGTGMMLYALWLNQLPLRKKRSE